MKFPLIGESHSRTAEPLPLRILLPGLVVLALCVAAAGVPLLHAPVKWLDAALVHEDVLRTSSAAWISVDWIPPGSPHLFPGLERLRDWFLDWQGFPESARFLARLCRVPEAWILTHGAGAAAAARLMAIFLHFFCAVMVWFLARRLRVGNGFLAALFFAAHPLVIGNLFWIHRLDAAAGLAFLLLACVLYLGHVRRRHRRWWHYPGALAATAGAMVMTPAAIILPALLALLALWWIAEHARRQQFQRRHARPGEGIAPDPDLEPQDDEPAVRRRSDEMEHEDWLRIHPLRRRWHHFRGRVQRKLARLGLEGLGAILGHPLMRAVISLLPFVGLAFLINVQQIACRLENASLVPDFARLAPDTSSVAAWMAAWGGGWFRALVPAGLQPLNIPFTLSPAGGWAALFALPLLLAAIVLLAGVFYGRRWAHYLALLLAASAVILLSAFAFPRPLSLAELLQSEKYLCWLLPIPCILVAALLAELGRSWAGAGLVLLAALGLADAGRVQAFRDPAPFRPGLQRQFAETALGETEKGLELARQGLLAEACEKYSEVVEAWPDYAPAWDAWGQAAYRLATMKKEDFSKAVERFDTACRLDPGEDNHRLRLAEACRRCYIDAEGPGHQRIFQEFNELIARHPGQPVLRQRLALAYLEQRSVQDALGLMEEAVALAPDNAGFRALCGQLRILCADPAGAAGELQAALKLDPACAPAHFGLAWLCLGAKPAAGEIDAHLAVLRRHAAGSPTVRIMCVLAAAAAGRAEETRALADAASKEFPDDLFLQVVLARILLLHENRGVRSPETALAILQRARNTPAFGGTVRAWQILAAAQAAAGDNAAAQESMGRAVLAAEAKQDAVLAGICRAQAALLAARRPLIGEGMITPLEKPDMTEILLRFLHEEEERATAEP